MFTASCQNCQFIILPNPTLSLTFSHFSESGQKQGSDHLVGEVAITIMKVPLVMAVFHTLSVKCSEQTRQEMDERWTSLIQ